MINRENMVTGDIETGRFNIEERQETTYSASPSMFGFIPGIAAAFCIFILRMALENHILLPGDGTFTTTLWRDIAFLRAGGVYPAMILFRGLDLAVIVTAARSIFPLIGRKLLLSPNEIRVLRGILVRKSEAFEYKNVVTLGFSRDQFQKLFGLTDIVVSTHGTYGMETLLCHVPMRKAKGLVAIIKERRESQE